MHFVLEALVKWSPCLCACLYYLPLPACLELLHLRIFFSCSIQKIKLELALCVTTRTQPLLPSWRRGRVDKFHL
ncbi:unnamed protein product, partial [Vitis vinifera]